MKQSLLRFFQCMLILGLATYLAWLIFTGKLSFYINLRFIWLTLAAVVGLSAMAVINLKDLFDNLSEDTQKKKSFTVIILLPIFASMMGLSWFLILALYLLVVFLGLSRISSSTDSAAVSAGFHSSYIVVIPLVLGVFVPAQALSTTSISSKGISLSAPSSIGDSSISTMNIVPDDRTILDWVKIFNVDTDPESYIGDEINVIGFVYHDSNLESDQFMVSRFVVTCCVADAFAIGMVVYFPESTSLADDSWVYIQGTIEVIERAGKMVPVIHASSVTPIEEPEQPYLYP